ncbi:MAG: hypothetical protein WB524_15315 [Acidobacteriaceae bacterium]
MRCLPCASPSSRETPFLKELPGSPIPDGTPAAGTSAATIAPTQTHTRENPLFSVLAEKRPLTHPSSTTWTIHLDFSIEDADLRYEAGDACAVIAQKFPALIDTILSLLSLSGNELMEIPKIGSVSLVDALLHHFAVNRLS